MMALVLISTGRVSQAEPWRILEVAIGQAPDVMALRIGKELKRLHEPAEALIPFTPNAAGQAEWIVEHVYVRGLNGSLSKVARTPGIEFTRKESAESGWIAQLVQCENQVSASRPSIGSFVRVLSGPCARLCGEVTAIKDQQCTVSISMPTKKVLVYATLHNLQVIECPPDKQNFFFQSELS